MGIAVTCPNCKALYNLSDSLEGKKVRCKKCQEIISVQRANTASTQVPRRSADGDDPGKGIAAAPKPRAVSRALDVEEVSPKARRPRREVEDDDGEIPTLEQVEEDDAADEPPRKKKRKKSRSGPGMAASLLVGCGALVGLAIIGFILLVILGGRPTMPTVPGNNNPLVSNPPFNPVAVNPQPGIPQAEALAFNQKFVVAQKRLEEAGKQFGQAMQTCLIQGGRNTLPVRTQYQSAQNTVNAVRTEVQSWAVPNSAAAKNLHQGYQRFLQGQVETMQKFGEIVAILENGALPPQQKSQRIQQIVQTVEAAERTQLAELQSLQREFARENKIMLLP